MLYIPQTDELLLLDGGNTYTSSGAGKAANGGSAIVVDLGANWSQRDLVGAYFQTGAIDFAGTNSYILTLQFSNTAAGAFTDLAGVATRNVYTADHTSGNIYTVAAQITGRYMRAYFTLAGNSTPDLVITKAAAFSISR